MREIGVHLRFEGPVVNLAFQAKQLGLSSFQCFFIDQRAKQLIDPSDEHAQQFLQWRDHFTALYAHASYWVNLADTLCTDHYQLEKELELARRLQFSHLVLHAGSTKGSRHKNEGIKAIARALNTIFKRNCQTKIVLENIAHDGLSIGGNLKDFSAIQARLDKPEQLLFCIDTAHAHAFGYDLISVNGQNSFIQHIDETIGLSSVALIHLNDTQEQRGSRIDRHCLIGCGMLGIKMLKQIITDVRLAHVPLIMELPAATHEDFVQQLTLVRNWF